MTKAMVLLCALLAACGDPGGAASSDGDERVEVHAQIDATATAADDETAMIETPFASILQECYAQASALGSRREVHAVGRYLALGDTMMVVRVSIPAAPRLARCIEDSVSVSVPPGAREAPDALVSGSFAIDLGGPPPPVQLGDIERQYEEHEHGMAALMREVIARGVLPSDHPLVRELLDADGSSH